jgi:glycosyltransferase involved in cell wall biosynthesis
MKIGFLVGDIVNISGGSNVIIEHAARLRDRGHDAILIPAHAVELQEPLWHPRLANLPLVPLSDAARQRFDFVFATWWVTFFDLCRLDSAVYGYLNQSLESRFHQESHYKLLNRITYSLPLLFVTEARWLEELIRQLQPNAEVLYVQNGLSREHFPCVKVPPPHGAPLRVLVEGHWNVGFKGVPETFEILETVPHDVALEIGWLTAASGGQRPRVRGEAVQVYERLPIDRVRHALQQYDVLLKLSKVEGVFGPPLEMFSQGGTAITYTVTGSDEYMVHGLNSLLVEPHNRMQIARYLKTLATTPGYVSYLRANALRTARSHPDWEDSTTVLEERLSALHRGGYRNAHVRAPLGALATLRAPMLEAVWQLEKAARAEPSAAAGERLLLERYRRMKESAPVRAARHLLPDALKQSIRNFLSRASS